MREDNEKLQQNCVVLNMEMLTLQQESMQIKQNHQQDLHSLETQMTMKQQNEMKNW